MMRHGLRASAILPFSRPLSADFFPGIIIRFNAHRTRHRIFVSSESADETVRSSIRVIFRRESLRVMKIDHRVVLFVFEQAPSVGTALSPYFPMLQFTGNESNAKIRGAASLVSRERWFFAG